MSLTTTEYKKVWEAFVNDFEASKFNIQTLEFYKPVFPSAEGELFKIILTQGIYMEQLEILFQVLKYYGLNASIDRGGSYPEIWIAPFQSDTLEEDYELLPCDCPCHQDDSINHVMPCCDENGMMRVPKN